MSENNDLITCPYCGSQNPSTFRFCSNCGERLNEKKEEAPVQETSFSEDAVQTPVQDPSAAWGAETEQPSAETSAFAKAEGEVVSGGAFSSQDTTGTYKPQEEIRINYERAAGDPVPAQTAVKEGNGNIGFAIASLICGILSILCCCFVWLALVLGIAGIVLGIITLTQKYEGKGMAIAGIITGGVGLLLFLIVLLVAGSTDAFTTLIDALNEY